ncbi:MAG: hypothetical protein Ct9H300mP32_3040 [Verrucomicrobiota bacterium]|nr:MAG: hypothetical protein Ct9H300mP32_3040 [Verrucomicrobiota bacterium]
MDLSQREAAMKGGEKGSPVVAGKPGESLLWKKVSGMKCRRTTRFAKRRRICCEGWIREGAQMGGNAELDPFS